MRHGQPTKRQQPTEQRTAKTSLVVRSRQMKPCGQPAFGANVNHIGHEADCPTGDPDF